MSTQFLERLYNPYDLLFRNLFEAGATFTPATEAKQQYPINIFEDDLYFSLKNKISLNPILNSFQKTVNVFSIDKTLIAAFISLLS